MTNTIFIIITIIITLTTKATKGDITCTAISTPDDTIIMCSFGVDIPTTLDGINVKYYESPDQPDGDTILLCNYTDSGDTIICHQNPDIVYHEIINKENVVIKRKPHHRRGGQYTCQVVPQLGVAIIPCNITLIGQGDEIQHTSDWVSVATLVLVLLVFISVIATILYWKRQRIRQWTRAPESTHVELEAESLTKEKDPKEDQSSPGMTLEVYYYNKGWVDACSYGFADKSKIPQSELKETTPGAASTYGASSGTSPSGPPYADQQVTFNTASPPGQKMSLSPGEDANRTAPQDVEGGQETDGEQTTAPLTVDEARRQVRDAEAKVQKTKKEKDKTQTAAKKKDNKHCEQVQTQAKEAKEQYERANKELQEAKSALKTIEKAEKNKSKK